ncbi:DNA-binding protein, partial [Hyella patelloides]|uniref:DNA-binding protein n=1 Tax=Hyella patelloides TaxID=1982969 RepID=UPI0016438821
LIPLHKGKPIIKKGKRGPAPRWRNPQKPAKTIIHVNTHKIKHNQKHSLNEPVITVKQRNTNWYGHEVEIPGGCRILYYPDNPTCGRARVWIETLYDVKVISRSL